MAADVRRGVVDPDAMPAVLSRLERFAAQLLAQHCQDWPRGESLDGIYAERIIKRADNALEVRGTCILITDQTETPIWIELAAHPTADRIAAGACRVGRPDESTGELLRLELGSKLALGLRARVADNPRDIPWMFEVTIEDSTVTGRGRRTRRCDECESLYFADTSQMAALCPECAHQLYNYPRCEHELRHGRCVSCYWDGAVSDYLANRQ